MNIDKPRVRVSIVIPVHNEERHVKACLQAISQQTVQPFEVIVVDNNSTDASVAVARSFSFVRVVEARQQGIVYARNVGFDAARGDVIGRIDADIQVPPTWVAHIQDFYDKPGNSQRAWSGAGFFYNMPLPRFTSWMYGKLAFGLNKLLIGHYTLWGSNMALTTQQWHAVRNKICTRIDIHEDLDLAMHVAETGSGITYDTTIKTNAELRRVNANRDKLWHYLQWWPNTLKAHHKKSWVVVWLVGAAGLYATSFVWLFMSKITHRATGRY